MELRSTSIADGGAIDRRHAWATCGGRNVSPDLEWSDAPEGTASFVLTCYDPDAPRGWWHWVVYDIPTAVMSLPEGGPLPEGAAETRNSFKAPGWGGPCPPPGPPHRYVFTLYALADERLQLSAGASPEQVAQLAEAGALATATLTGTYQR